MLEIPIVSAVAIALIIGGFAFIGGYYAGKFTVDRSFRYLPNDLLLLVEHSNKRGR